MFVFTSLAVLGIVKWYHNLLLACGPYNCKTVDRQKIILCTLNILSMAVFVFRLLTICGVCWM